MRQIYSVSTHFLKLETVVVGMRGLIDYAVIPPETIKENEDYAGEMVETMPQDWIRQFVMYVHDAPLAVKAKV